MDIDVFQATGILRRRFPELDIGKLSLVSRSDFDTFEADSGLIFRFPRDAGSAHKLEREAAILPQLQARLPITISSPEFWSKADDAFPWPIAGYRKIPGASGEEQRPAGRDWRGVAATLADVFSALHTFPLEDAHESGVEFAPAPDLAQMLQHVTSFAAVIRAVEPDLCSPLVETYLDATVDVPSIGALPQALSHADLKGEHFIVDNEARRLIGVVDWSDICLTDPIVDFAYTFMWLGEQFVGLVLDRYACPDRGATLNRAAFIARCHTLTGLGRQLSGESYGPLPLLKTQLAWAFR